MGNILFNCKKIEDEPIYYHMSEKQETHTEINHEENTLNKPNIRLEKIQSYNIKYADDILHELDHSLVINNLNNYKLVDKKEGFTSYVEIYQYKNDKIIKKIYKKNGVNINYFVDFNCIDESYHNELNALKILQNELHFPKLICYDVEELSITMNYVGEILQQKKENISLDEIPKNWKEQFYYILMMLKKYNLYHNDITERNICLQNNRLTLIDYGNCKTHIDTYYRNYNIDILNNSNNIIDFLSEINNNAMKMRKCLHGFN